jgi:CheY-like chemotaxis protein
MKLLIAEDDTFFRKLLYRVLSPEYDITEAKDGNQAWEILQKADSPQLAILDWVMPGANGPELCRRVR